MLVGGTVLGASGTAVAEKPTEQMRQVGSFMTATLLARSFVQTCLALYPKYAGLEPLMAKELFTRVDEKDPVSAAYKAELDGGVQIWRNRGSWTVKFFPPTNDNVCTAQFVDLIEPGTQSLWSGEAFQAVSAAAVAAEINDTIKTATIAARDFPILLTGPNGALTITMTSEYRERQFKGIAIRTQTVEYMLRSGH